MTALRARRLGGRTAVLRGAGVVFALLTLPACGTDDGGLAAGPDGPEGPPVLAPGFEPEGDDEVGGSDGTGLQNETGGGSTGEGSPGGRPNNQPVTNPEGGGTGGGGQGGTSSTGDKGHSDGEGGEGPNFTPGGPGDHTPQFDDPDVALVLGGPTSPDLQPAYFAAAVGNEVKRTFVVRNEGLEDVALNDVVLHGPDNDAFSVDATSCSGDVLAPGDSCTVEVSYLPTDAGIKSATLVVPLQDGTVAEVPLEGEATP